jgi:hypothetical protein
MMELNEIKDMLLHLKSAVDKIQATQDVQFNRLFGNGQKGAIEKLEERTAALEVFKDTEIGRKGIMVAFASFISMVATELVHLFIWKRL